MLLLLLALVVTTGAAIAQVWTNLRVLDYGYRISTAERAKQKLQQENRKLRVELAFMKNPQRLSNVALKKYKLRPPEPEQVRRIRKTSPLKKPEERLLRQAFHMPPTVQGSSERRSQ